MKKWNFLAYLNKNSLSEKIFLFTSITIIATLLIFIVLIYTRVKLFKDQTNERLGKYIVAVRMKNAKEFINKGEANLEILASKVGYRDTLYFTKCFKKFYGFTPSQYIRGHEGEEVGSNN